MYGPALFRRPSPDFRFHGHPAPVPTAQEIFEGEEAARRRGPKSPRERLQEARAAQAASGVRIRIWRPVKNQRDFEPELKVWHPSHQEGTSVRRNLGALSLTLFDTAQQPLRAIDESHTKELITERLEAARSTIFMPTGHIAVSGTALFGNSQQPFVGLTFAPSPLTDELRTIRHTVAPELYLDDSHQKLHRLHVSLGRVFSAERAEEIRELLTPALPTHVQFGPAQVTIEHQ